MEAWQIVATVLGLLTPPSLLIAQLIGDVRALKQEAATLKEEVDRLRNWKHNEFPAHISRLDLRVYKLEEGDK